MATKSKGQRKKTAAVRRSKKTPSRVPAVRHLRYEITNSGSAGTETSHFIDLARDLSAINRRLYRQGMVYHVSKVTVVSRNTAANTPGQSAGFISVSVAPNSWSVRSAWRFGKSLWDSMQKQAMESVPNDLRPRYNDFKIRGLESNGPSMILPKDNGGNDLVLGEWAYSVFISPDGTTGADEYSAHLLGAHAGSAGSYTSVGLVESYGNTRATVATDVPSVNSAGDDDPLANLFDHGTVVDEILSDINAKGDTPPYSLFEYPGSAGNHPKPLVVQHGTLGADGRVVLGGFEAMCGLIELEASSPHAGDVYSVLVELAPGAVRGVKAEAI